jgi:hypothetical protein
MQKTPKRVIELAEQLTKGQPSRRFRVRAILKWFGAARKGAKKVDEIAFVLSSVGLITDPPLEKTKIDEQVRFLLSSKSKVGISEDVNLDVPESKSPDEETAAAESGQSEDATKEKQLTPQPPQKISSSPRTKKNSRRISLMTTR